jgi:G3E family GTPase
VSIGVPVTIPVTIIGGFLGAGKTTALNHLLRTAQSRIGVLVNDFGAINVDAALIEARDGEMIALSNGCVCCAVGPDFGESLARMLHRDPPPDRIVVETSGVSDPWRIAQLTRLEPGAALDAVLVLADATAFPAQLADRWLTDTLTRQIARADIVLVSKCDAANAAARAATTAAVRRLRPDARIAEIAGGAVPASLLGGDDPAPSSRRVADAPDHPFRTWHLSDTGPFDTARLSAVLASLPPAVLRAKGIVRIGPDAVPHVLQLVGKRWTLEAWHGRSPPTGLVIIGTPDLPPPADLAAMFARAMTSA